MAVAQVSDLKLYAEECARKAARAADKISLSTFTENKVKRFQRAKEAVMLSTAPTYEDIETFQGIKAWAAIVYFDLRKSSDRAMKIGPRDMYVTMHTYLPVMLRIVEKASGVIGGLRGDGAMAAFGIVEITEAKRQITKEEGNSGVSRACQCGDAITKATDLVINPTLTAMGIEGGLMVGVGIDAADVVITMIGTEEAQEVTVYGSAVNNACHRSEEANNEVILTNRARLAFPKKTGGPTKFSHRGADAYVLHYPKTYRTLA